MNSLEGQENSGSGLFKTVYKKKFKNPDDLMNQIYNGDLSEVEKIEDIVVSMESYGDDNYYFNNKG